MRLLITGGAGFVGSSLALAFRADHPTARIIAFDNLRRRGSELTLPRLAAAGIEFIHGDVRNPTDLAGVGPFDALIECSAEPSVHAGYGEGPDYVVETNLMGTFHCLEAARRSNALVLFLSTSRVYPIAGLRALPVAAKATRLALPPEAEGPGWSAAGIGMDFPMGGSRSLYGATKLASEHLAEEYSALYGLGVVVNRCGVLAGPGQMGKVDQGFMALWCARHLFGGTLSYSGFGGQGLQVRDVLHVADLYRLLARQLVSLKPGSYRLFNAGGGAGNAVSLAELTGLCAHAAGRQIHIGSQPETRAADIPWYVTDNAAVSAATGWKPLIGVSALVYDVFAWLRRDRAALEPIFARG